MSKKTKPKNDQVQGISTLEIPFSSKEKRALDKILNTPHWGRRKKKDEFIGEYGRLPEEVDAYIMANGKRKKPTESTKDAPEVEVKQAESSKRAPIEESTREKGKTVQLRFPIKAMRIEGNDLVVDIKVPE